jgi:hypothetical protein
MHLFLIRTPSMDSFWHLHPERTADGGFGARLPAMPPGRYQLFADVVLRNGFPITMTGQIDASQIRGKPLAGDDSGIVTSPISIDASDTTEAALPEGARMIWERDAKPFRNGTPLIFRFRVLDGHGKPGSKSRWHDALERQLQITVENLRSRSSFRCGFSQQCATRWNSSCVGNRAVAPVTPLR